MVCLPRDLSMNHELIRSTLLSLYSISVSFFLFVVREKRTRCVSPLLANGRHTYNYNVCMYTFKYTSLLSHNIRQVVHDRFIRDGL